MLKIKDNVDLKELYNYDFNRFSYYSNNGYYYGRGRLHIDEKSRIIEIPTYSERYDIESYIKDLEIARISRKSKGVEYERNRI